MPMYHFRLPNGEEYASENLSKIKKQYPQATIIGRVEFDEVGNSVVKPYSGDQPPESPARSDEKDARSDEPDDAVEITIRSGKSAEKRSDTASEKVAAKDVRKDAKAS